MEDKQRICDLLLPALQATHNLRNLISLQYNPEDDSVTAVLPGGTRQANVALDSGTSMIRDIIRQIV